MRAKVTSVTDDGVLCSLLDGVRGLVTVDHMPGTDGRIFYFFACFLLYIVILSDMHNCLFMVTFVCYSGSI